MLNYEKRLNEFAQGKRLLRLARPIRDRRGCEVRVTRFCETKPTAMEAK